jgi:branched-chain amino acid transport system substrate-binding protein
VPGTDSPGAARLEEMLGMAVGPFVAESYDAAALILLAMQAAGSMASGEFKDHVMAVANAPGEQILPGELEKALGILAEGDEIDYVGATAVELVGAGESAGNYRQMAVENGPLPLITVRAGEATIRVWRGFGRAVEEASPDSGPGATETYNQVRRIVEADDNSVWR